ncbi:E3 ubiquitin-protein ligase listerin [Venturia canescens]|uniref:E3 ubiquitin-protein ligase listerin n=1 Tax=Venturia canescens TaxID=32260 RepID=UPI001C9C9ACD|nr:E3 ubiquitin-protein ligase listerin [Venturia canescens]
MGKNKAQRTKNNAKPSNSSRSAELLGTSMPNFVGFSAVKDGGYIPVLPGFSLCTLNDIEINAIETNFQLVLKKMNKKDATTKFKALQEFAELCRDAALPSVEAVLPFWPRLYALLCIDEQHRVREAVQVAHAALAKRVGRNIAVYLKQLAGPWFTSQFDTYPPAASAATNSFQETFPQRKIVDAIVHCQEEILSYISDTIRVQTPQSMSTHKTLTVEELETKYQRVLIASLQAYSAYLKKVPSVQIEKTENSHQQIISSAKFWKLPKHDSLLVKTSFFNALASLIENATKLIMEEKKRAITAIMNSLDETDPNLLSSVWESMLVAITKIDDWHLSVSIGKLVLPKLWRVLKSGGQCCASVVYPNLLPFVSQFPKFDVDQKTLFINFFTYMREGFTAKSVLLSRSEMFAVTKSFTECLRYVILLHKNDEELCEELLKNQLMPVIELSITETGPLKTVLFCEVTQLVRYWSKNRNNAEYPMYGKIVEKFWRELETTFVNILKRMDEEYDKSLNINDTQIELLCSLKNAPTHSRKNLRVKFSDPNEPQEERSQIKPNESEEDLIFLAELDRFVNNLCVAYLNKNTHQSSYKNVEFLNHLVTSFESEQLFIGIAKAYRDDADLFQFYDKVLKNWLLDRPEARRASVQLVFSSLKYMDDTSKILVLKSLTELDDSTILRSAVTCALSEKNRNDPIIRKWCRESPITEQLLAITKNVTSNENVIEELNDDEDILILAFETSSDGEPCVSQEAISRISNILCDYLTQEKLSDLANVAELISRLLQLTWNHKYPTGSSIKMLRSLFELSLRDPLNTSEVPAIDMIRNSWKSGVAMCNEKLKREEVAQLHEECMDLIHEKIYSSHDSQIEDVIVDYTIDFIEAASHFDAGGSLRSAIEFNTRDKIFTEEWIPQSLGLAIYGEILSGNFYLSNPLRSVVPHDSPIKFVTLKEEFLPDQTENCIKWASFNSKLLNKLIRKLDYEDMNDEVDSGVIDCLTELPYMLNYILLIASLGHVYSHHFKSSKNYERIETTLNNLVVECVDLRVSVPKNIWNRILTDSLNVDDSWIEYGSLFSQFLRLFYGSDEHLLEVEQLGPQTLTSYVESQDVPELARDLKAIVMARCILDNQSNVTNCLKVLEKMVKRHQSKTILLLLNTDVSRVEWSDLVLPLEIIRLFGKFVKIAPTKLSSGLWDAAIIFLASWQNSVNESKFKHEDSRVRALTVAVSELYYEIQSLFEQHERESIDGLPSALLDEWKNVFADEVHHGMASTWIFFVGLYNKKSDFLMPGIVLDYLGKAMSVIDGKTFFKNHPADQSSKITSKEITKLSLKLLPSPVLSLQLAGYHVLSRVIPSLVEQDKLLLENENWETKDLNIRKFEDVLLSTQKIVNTMLMGFKLCDTTSCTIQPHTDSYTYTIGYLLAWANVLDMCAHAHADVRYQYAEFLKDNYFPYLLNNIFRLMPVEILQDSKTKSSKFTEIFSTLPSFEFRESWTEWRLDHIVCWLFTNSLRHLPVLVRQWWGTADSRISAAVEKITTLYVSPMLCKEELLNNRLVDIQNMQIKVLPSAREVVALYQMDDTKLELSMVLPVNHPLGPVTVEPGQHAGGAANWRNCHMQLSIFLTHQNGSIWDGLLMWKKNLDKKFSGVEECFICYSIFHINTYQIPKLSCHTCRKKFHAPCLYKWFTTSQKSTCPICRNIF